MHFFGRDNGGGGVRLLLVPSDGKVPAGTTGAGLFSLRARGLKGTIAYSKVSGSAKVTFPGSVATIGTALSDGETATFVGRAQNGIGGAIEGSFTLTGEAGGEVGPGIISGTLDAGTIGAAYSDALTVTPPGAITLSSDTLAWLASHTIAHNGSGAFTSAGID